MAATLRAAVLSYKLSFVASELPTVKLKQDFDDNSSKEKKCPIFNGDFGIEALLYVEERFRKIANRTLLWRTGIELFNGFEEVLLDTALTNWEGLKLLTSTKLQFFLKRHYKQCIANTLELKLETFKLNILKLFASRLKLVRLIILVKCSLLHAMETSCLAMNRH